MSPEVRGVRFDVARITVELTSPFLVGTGRGDALHDTQFASNADGLPVLPGSSIAGLLRHAWARKRGEHSQKNGANSAVGRAFGFQHGDDGAASRVEISFGYAHDAVDRPVPFMGRLPQDDDNVLRALRKGVLRDHVRIDGRGVADGRGKFDIWMVPMGARFTFEIVVHEDAGVSADELVHMLHGEALRIGARTRSGLGRFNVVRARVRSFDLTNSADFEDFSSKLPRRIEDTVPDDVLPLLELGRGDATGFVSATIVLEPESWWMFGGGLPIRKDHTRAGTDDPVDRVNVNEACIRWERSNGADVGRVFEEGNSPDVAPATGLKGALRHRVAFHARRAARNWTSSTTSAVSPDDEPAVIALFGQVARRYVDDNQEPHEQGRVGRLFIDDGRIEGDLPGYLDHVSLDRFTQGPVTGLLFNEAPRFGGTLTFRLTVDTSSSVDSTHRKALKRALHDLVSGRLGFGAAGSRGLGYAKNGSITWTDEETWLNG